MSSAAGDASRDRSTESTRPTGESQMNTRSKEATRAYLRSRLAQARPSRKIVHEPIERNDPAGAGIMHCSPDPDADDSVAFQSNH